MRLLHFSDPHLQLPGWRARTLRELGALRSVARVELWRGRGEEYDAAPEVLRAIVRAAAEADHVICTGDLTQLGAAEEFALARDLLAPLEGKLTLLAGNHDRYPLGLQPNRLFEEHFPAHAATGQAQTVLVGSELALFKLDSAGEVSWPVVSRGHLSRAALGDLSRALASPSLEGRCKLVLVHHAPSRADGGAERSLAGGPELLRVAAEGGAAAVLCGHLHERYDLPAGPGRARLLCAGSSTSRGQEGYFELEVDGGRLAAARMCHL